MDTSKLKPFNLERALAGDPVVTGDGRKVIEIHYNEKEANQQWNENQPRLGNCAHKITIEE